MTVDVKCAHAHTPENRNITDIFGICENPLCHIRHNQGPLHCRNQYIGINEIWFYAIHSFSDKMHKGDIISSNTNNLYSSDRVPIIHLDSLPKILICKSYESTYSLTRLFRCISVNKSFRHSQLNITWQKWQKLSMIFWEIFDLSTQFVKFTVIFVNIHFVNLAYLIQKTLRNFYQNIAYRVHIIDGIRLITCNNKIQILLENTDRDTLLELNQWQIKRCSGIEKRNRKPRFSATYPSLLLIEISISKIELGKPFLPSL